MKTESRTISERVIALLLSVMMIISLMPISAVMSLADPVDPPFAGITISIEDEDGNPLPGASVTFKVDSVSHGDNYVQGESLAADATGTVNVLSEDSFELNDLDLTITDVDLDGYTYDESLLPSEAQIETSNQCFTLVMLKDVSISANTGLVYSGEAQDLVSVTKRDGITPLPEGFTVEYAINGLSSESGQATEAGNYKVDVTVKKGDDVFATASFVSIEIAKKDIPVEDEYNIICTDSNYDGSEKSLVVISPKDSENHVTDDDEITILADYIGENVEFPYLSCPKVGVGEYKLGDFDFRVKIHRNDNYNDYEVSLTKKMLNGELDGFSEDPENSSIEYYSGSNSNNPVYDAMAHCPITELTRMVDDNPVDVLSSKEYTVTISVNNSPFAEWNDDSVKIEEAKTYSVVVKVKYNLDDGYALKEFSTNITIDKAPQTLSFAEDAQEEITIDPLNNEYDYSIESGESGNAVSYALVDCTSDDVATIVSSGENAGTLTVLKEGVVTVKATCPGNSNYEETSIYKTVVMKAPSDDIVSFEKTDFSSYIDINGNVASETAEKKYEEDTGSLHYSINANGFAFGIDETKGTITVGKDFNLKDFFNAVITNNFKPVVTVNKDAGKINAIIHSGVSGLETKEELTEIYPEKSTSYNLMFSVSGFSDICEIRSVPSTGWYNQYKNTNALVSSVDPAKYLLSIDGNNYSEEVIIKEERSSVSQDILYEDRTKGIPIYGLVKIDGIKNDITAPSEVSIEYPSPLQNWFDNILGFFSFGLNKPSVKITFSATDVLSGVKSFTWSYARQDGASEINVDENTNDNYKNVTVAATQVSDSNKYTATITLPKEEADQLRGNITVYATDVAGNNSDTYGDNKIIVIDSKNPLFESVEYSNNYNYNTNNELYYGKNEDNNNIPEISFTLNEANFFSDDVKVYLVQYDNLDSEEGTDTDISEKVTWSNPDGDNFKGTFLIDDKVNAEDGYYRFKVEYTDRSENSMTTYLSDKMIVIDTEKPVLDIEFSHNDSEKDDNQIVTFKVKDRNFLLRKDSLEVTGTIGDINKGSVRVGDSVFGPSDITSLLKDENAEWTGGADTGYEYSFSTDKLPDGNYDIKFNYTDISKNVADEVENSFSIDHKAPTDIEITFSNENKDGFIQNKTIQTIIDNVLETITFGFYKPTVKVTFTAKDETVGVKNFTWSYARQDGASEINVDEKDDKYKDSYVNVTVDATRESNNSNKYTATITLPKEEAENLRGNISVVATDNYYNEDSNGNDRVVVVDNKAPKITVNYSSKAKPRFVDATYTDVDSDSFEDEKTTQAFYNSAVTATITIDEANFFEGVDNTHEVGILLTKTDNEETITQTEYMPADSVEMYSEVSDKQFFVWNTDPDNGDKHTFEITLDENADYQLEVVYTDYSSNPAIIASNDGISVTDGKYVSKTITVDKIAPEITVDYTNDGYVATIDDIDYFYENRTATITVNEHNFRPSDIDVSVTAKTVDGKDIEVADFAEALKDWNNWTPNTLDNSNVYVATIAYSVEANYTFDIKYTDLAKNEFGVDENDYDTDKFTIDKTQPKVESVEYSTSVLDTILSDGEYGFYNAMMTVTITATDDISGVNRFDYKYITADNVSKVNASIDYQEIIEGEKYDGATITKSDDGRTAVLTFTIPKYVLGSDNQFNGTVKYDVKDRSGRTTGEKSESKRVVVDNIPPISEVKYNDPVNDVNDISYYEGPISGVVTINEANFYSSDVVIRVSKNGGTPEALPTKWVDVSVDEHVGTFELDEDADYVVSITYKDKSGNTMVDYVSNQLTIDTKDPVISVDGIKHQSANNGEVISITVAVTDTNIALDSFKPVLNAVIKKDEGNNKYTYQTVPVDLGTAVTTTNANGETVHTYTVANLTLDGFYSLTCSAVDYANHSVTAISTGTAAGGTVSIDTVNFSVNREGSVFWLTTEHNDKYTGETFFDELNGAYANDEVKVVLHEINVDEVDENPDKRTVFTLNDGSESEDITLVEREGGTGNYDKNVRVGAGGWYENTYTLYNDNFDHDGVYSLNIVTYDKAENSNVNTKFEAAMISFTLDRTNPVVSANIQNDQRIKASEYWVEFEITETNLDDKTIVVKVTDNNGRTVDTELVDLGNNEYKFLIKNGYNYTVEIVAKDLAGNESELYKVEHLTVSTNIIILWYANTPLFWGSIGGVIVLAGGITVPIIMKRRKLRVK